LAPEWQGALAYDEFRCNVVAVKPVPWGALPRLSFKDSAKRRWVRLDLSKSVSG